MTRLALACCSAMRTRAEFIEQAINLHGLGRAASKRLVLMIASKACGVNNPGCHSEPRHHLAAVAAIAGAAAARARPAVDGGDLLHALAVPVEQALGAPPQGAFAALGLPLRRLLPTLRTSRVMSSCGSLTSRAARSRGRYGAASGNVSTLEGRCSAPGYAVNIHSRSCPPHEPVCCKLKAGSGRTWCVMRPGDQRL